MAIKNTFEIVQGKSVKTDGSLHGHVASLQTQAIKRLEELEKKILRAERRKYETTQRQINSLKTALFPNDSLQERVENFSTYYSRYGSDWINIIYQASTGLNMKFVLLVLD
jgi:uncharacterized protein YllA (UPF0747 family)